MGYTWNLTHFKAADQKLVLKTWIWTGIMNQCDLLTYFASIYGFTTKVLN